jgi:hypothetical protein
MGKIVISANLSLDGVVQDPTEWAKVELGEALRAEALLMGQLSDDWFGERWSYRTGEWADTG